ncbi:isoquinoline 1-oxidoreductase beta subunit [Pseudomonas sp. PvR086]|jgi:isoquinoline 1-oxidoreductase beta subunit|uniref:xanthine dehydrogenase family protein molybdopterin-binding subunit n=1 Tax=Pseudomonas TaxID=286 RepID=UPI000B3561A0|nr:MULTISPECIES: xanthine dehydrogenase family protein molybdopterin-binding subunit [Pseudomonas]MBD9609392.1 xanthine dehydrogenase family protein molybdopterin-binding subunit [Pseudomonas sp. PDM08]MDR7108871.1 isoquinoline 1-oxidoreductase beta subunit [Pseudomonas frederiksbergensis]PMY50311.1 xanthine dehydrogenase family protein molybdopterin-binding subunit [Pseudomonas sp. FW305-53]PMY84419.1 xanthine dehydrogenase family protein molybdopterin-binding subunit [Pseudomonas sp. FW303-C2
MNSINPVSRRGFLKGSAVLGGGLVVAFVIPGGHRFAFGAENQGEVFAPNAFLRIGNDNSVIVLLGHSEMGQGIWTGLTMLIAEELDADWSKIRVEHAPASAAEYGLPAFGGMQITGGSTSTWMEFDRYRQAGAAARLMLIDAAAKRFDMAPSQISTESGVVIAGDKRATYGELADDAGKLPVPDPASIKFKEAKDWKVIGKPTKRLDTPEKITGQAKFGMDVQFDGLMTAVVARPPVFGGSVKSFEGAEALAVPGVHKVVQVPTGVAVIADHYWAAKLGRDALKVVWEPGPNAGLDSQQLLESFRKLAATPGTSVSQAGDATVMLGRAAKTIEAEYSVPYLAHAPMEPLNCTVNITKDKCEIWTGTQFQTLDQMIAGKITGLKPEQVEIHTQFLGGGFGRRANPTSDFVSEAVYVAKAAGEPVKTVWSREDDIRGGYYRSAFLHQARIGLDADGMPIAWKHMLVGQSIMAGTSFEATMVKDGVDKTSVEGVADSPYFEGLANHLIDLHSPQTGISVLWLRSVGHTHTAFVMESLIDELAEAAGKDPVEYRRTLLKAHPRHLGVLNLAVEKADWKAPLPDGHALGVAVHESFGSYVAHVAEVSQDNLAIRVHRVVCAVDCGIAVNPQSIAAQMESGITFGLGFTLHSKLTFKNGQVQQSNFHDYQVLRLNEMPVVEVHIVPSTDKPGGIGEVGVPPVAPAVANAVFALTGQRLRELPLQLSGV